MTKNKSSFCLISCLVLVTHGLAKKYKFAGRQNCYILITRARVDTRESCDLGLFCSTTPARVSTLALVIRNINFGVPDSRSATSTTLARVSTLARVIRSHGPLVHGPWLTSTKRDIYVKG